MEKESLYSYDDFMGYQDRVVRKLRERLILRGVDVDCIKEGMELYDWSCNRFDLVVLDSADKETIRQIYEVKTLSSKDKYPNYILALLEKRKRMFPDAKVFLVYMGIIDIVIESLEDLRNKANRHISDKYEKNAISSLEEYYRAIKDICNTEDEYCFRGHSNAGYECLPSVYRRESLIKNEHKMIFEAERRCPSTFPDDMRMFDKLAKMQHLGLPTRLLDVTTNPLVALYFACTCSTEEKEQDGQVLVFPIDETKYTDSDSVCIVAHLARRPSDFLLQIKDDREKFVYDIQQEKNNFEDGIREEDIYSVHYVLPKLNNERLIRQSGAFFLFGMSKDEGKTRPAEFPNKPTKINIKAEAKESILKELVLMGVSEPSLFPQEDKIMDSIKKQYDY